MTVHSSLRRFRPLETLDLLLAGIAIAIQLPRSDYEKAVSRFETMRDWIDREESPLHGLVLLMDPQGSMAIGATVARASRTDEFDVDAMAELRISHFEDPQRVLDLLYEAIRGESGSRYYESTVRHTRCVTVRYRDGMHIDITPAVLWAERTPRTCTIFHHREDDSNEPKARPLANPHRFAVWFNARTPKEEDFAVQFAERSFAYEMQKVQARAPANPIPEQEKAHEKSKALVTLQLVKRWRNVLFDKPERKNLREPPSVYLAKLIAVNANQTMSLAEELEHQVTAILTRVRQAHDQRRLVHEVNPFCDEDVLTDRWPGDLSNQSLFVADLSRFLEKIKFLRSGRLRLDEMADILEDLFGERPARDVVGDFVRKQAKATSQSTSRIGDLGRLAAPSVVAGPSLATGRPIPKHEFFSGSVRQRR